MGDVCVAVPTPYSPAPAVTTLVGDDSDDLWAPLSQHLSKRLGHVVTVAGKLPGGHGPVIEKRNQFIQATII